MGKIKRFAQHVIRHTDGTKKEVIEALKERMDDLELRATRLERKAEIYRGR